MPTDKTIGFTISVPVPAAFDGRYPLMNDKAALVQLLLVGNARKAEKIKVKRCEPRG